MNEFIAEIPTGAPQCDMNIIVAGCKNGMADDYIISAVKPLDSSIARDVATVNGVDVSIRAAVIDQCILVLRSKDESFVTSALRLLVKIKAVSRISLKAIENFCKKENTAIAKIS
jgi:hypothetical protein